MNEKFENINCNLCGENDTVALAKKGQFNLPANVVICRNCGLTYLNPRWTKSTYFDFYTNHYDKYYRPDIKKISVKKDDVNAIYERFTKAGLLDKPVKHMLDIGSGSGLNLDFFKLKYPKANFYAIEPSDTAVTILKKNAVEVISRDVDTDWHKPVQKKFDLIIMRHVLEHLSDPIAALTKIESTLADDGILYIAVPNCANPIAPLLAHWFRAVHTYYFNKKTINGILHKSNLHLLKAVEGDKMNRGELIVYAKKGKDNSTTVIDPTNFEEQLEVYKSRLAKETQTLPTIKRKINLINEKIKRTLK